VNIEMTDSLHCATVQKQISDAADVVTALMEDITEQLFVPTAIADITGTLSSLSWHTASKTTLYLQ